MRHPEIAHRVYTFWIGPIASLRLQRRTDQAIGGELVNAAEHATASLSAISSGFGAIAWPWRWVRPAGQTLIWPRGDTAPR